MKKPSNSKTTRDVKTDAKANTPKTPPAVKANASKTPKAPKTPAELPIHQIMEQNGSFVYEIDPHTYRLLNVEGRLESHKPGQIGGICYEEIWNGIAPCNNCPLWKMKKDDFGFYNFGVQTRNFDSISGRWLDVQSFCFRDADVDDPKQQRVVILCYDITPYVRQFTEHDELTPAYSFVYFKTQATKIVEHNPENRLAVIYLDIRNFKNINLAYGYTAGNHVLISLVRIIHNNLYGDELIARISGDKFIILKYLDDPAYIQHDSLDDRAARICHDMVRDARVELYSALGKSIDSKLLRVVGGISIVNNTETNIDIYIDRAGAANHRAGKNHTLASVYDEELRKRDQTRRNIEMSMENAIVKNEFLVYFQPKVSIASNMLCGAEALVRWQRPAGGMIFPDDFIPIFERNGFIVKLDFYVYETTMRAMRRWLDMGAHLPPISLNVSRAHLSKDNFVSRIYSLTQEYNIPTSLIELELTESLLFNDADKPTEILAQLQELGFAISIDDFGSGYSSFLLLKDMPVDIIKLDKTFFSGEYIKPKDKVILETIMDMARRLDLKIICEGVETAEQMEYLREINCDMAQGYYFSRPVPMDEFEKALF